MKSTQAKASKAIKAELKSTFPTTKFSVTSESFAGGNSVRISWTDGPQEKDVKSITDKYQYGSFNGMEDIYEYNNKNEDLPQAKYVQVSRHISAQNEAKAIDQINEDFGLNIQYIIEKSVSSEFIRIVNDDYLDNMGAWTSQFVYRQMKEMGY